MSMTEKIKDMVVRRKSRETNQEKVKLTENKHQHENASLTE